MYLLAPSNPKELNDRIKWFKHPIARRLAQEKQVEFGFELKGEPETITQAPPLFWGYHLPDYFATEWYYHPEKRAHLMTRLKNLAALKPDYVNFHGTHLWWQPDSQEKIERYLNRSEPEEYLKVLDSNIEFIKEVKKILPQARLTLENYPLYGYYRKDGQILPETYLYTGSGRLNDLLYLQEKTDVEILLDIEHLILTLNFLNRRKNYATVPVQKIENPSVLTQKLYDIFGFYIEKDYYPYTDREVTYEEMVAKIHAKFYHLTGSTQDVISGKRDVTHGPIEKDDKVFREHLRVVLAQNPEAMLVETADSTTNPCFHYLRPNETELSFYNLCEILLAELSFTFAPTMLCP